MLFISLFFIPIFAQNVEYFCTSNFGSPTKCNGDIHDSSHGVVCGLAVNSRRCTNPGGYLLEYVNRTTYRMHTGCNADCSTCGPNSTYTIGDCSGGLSKLTYLQPGEMFTIPKCTTADYKPVVTYKYGIGDCSGSRDTMTFSYSMSCSPFDCTNSESRRCDCSSGFGQGYLSKIGECYNCSGVANCQTCGGADNCSVCASGYYRSAGTYMRCNPCHSLMFCQENSCTNDGKCTACITDSGLFPNSEGECQSCDMDYPSYCLNCQTFTRCAECRYDYLEVNERGHCTRSNGVALCFSLLVLFFVFALIN